MAAASENYHSYSFCELKHNVDKIQVVVYFHS